MSTVAIPADISNLSPAAELPPQFAAIAQPVRARRLPADALRRRANPQQGRALESIGHAIEYLVDSRLFITSGLDDRAEQEAIQALMRSSRAVFAECAEVVMLRTQLARWLGKRLPWTASIRRG